MVPSPLAFERRQVMARGRSQPGLKPLQDVDRPPEIVALLRVEAARPFADQIGLDRRERVAHIRVVEEHLDADGAAGPLLCRHLSNSPPGRVWPRSAGPPAVARTCIRSRSSAI